MSEWRGVLHNSDDTEPPVGVKLIEEENKWYWVDDIEIPNGPFDTRYAAVQAAWAAYNCTHSFWRLW